MSPRDESSADPAARSLGSVLDFLGQIWELDHALQRRSKRMQKELGITAPQRLVLRIVGRFPGMPAGELATLLHLDPSTLSGILKRLERDGWLRRRDDPRDGRRALLGLTERGRELDGESSGTVEDAVRATLDALSPHELATVRRVLKVLAQRLEKG
jgi:DNA-binding MarR family transcriptional regulator